MEGSLYSERVKGLRELMKTGGIGGFVFTASVNMYYFTGFLEIQRPRFLSLLVPADGDPVFLVPVLYAEEIKETWVKKVVTWTDGEDPIEMMASLIKESGLTGSDIAVDDTMWGTFLLRLQRVLGSTRFIPGGDYTQALRRIKSRAEIDMMMHIGDITDKVMKEVVASIRPGITELDVDNIIKSEFRKGKALPSGPLAIVASGMYSAQPHHMAADRVINPGEPVVLDFGGLWQGYHSDVTRTIFVGKPDKEFLEIYDIVRRAQEAALESVKPGVACESLDAMARDIITSSGYGDYFVHRTGHGIGLEVHEEPYIAAGNKVPLEVGMVFSIEPGIYIPGRYGVRIEDCVAVLDGGAEPLTKFTHDLVVID